MRNHRRSPTTGIDPMASEWRYINVQRGRQGRIAYRYFRRRRRRTLMPPDPTSGEGAQRYHELLGLGLARGRLGEQLVVALGVLDGRGVRGHECAASAPAEVAIGDTAPRQAETEPLA